MKKKTIGIFIFVLLFCISLFNIKTVYTLIVKGTTVLGDADGNWIIEKNDAKSIGSYIIDKDVSNGKFYTDNSDYNADGSIKINDAVKVLNETTNGTIVFIPTQGMIKMVENGNDKYDIFDSNEAILFRSADGKLALLDTAQNRQVACDKISSMLHAYAGVSDNETVDLEYLIISHSHLDHTGCFIHFLENSSGQYSSFSYPTINIKNIVIKNESTAPTYSKWSSVYSFASENKGTANLITTNNLEEGYTLTLGSGTDAMKLHLYNVDDIYKNESRCWNGTALASGKSIGFDAYNSSDTAKPSLTITGSNSQTFYAYLPKANSQDISYINTSNAIKRGTFDSNGAHTNFYGFVRGSEAEACNANANSIAVLAEIPIQGNDKKYLYFPSDLENNGYSHVGEYDSKYGVRLTSHGTNYFYQYNSTTNKFVVSNNKLVKDSNKTVQIPREYEISLAIRDEIGAENLDKLVLYQASHHGINVDKASIDALNINRNDMKVVFTRHKNLYPLDPTVAKVIIPDSSNGYVNLNVNYNKKHMTVRSYYYNLNNVDINNKYYVGGNTDDGTLQFTIRNNGTIDVDLRK